MLGLRSGLGDVLLGEGRGHLEGSEFRGCRFLMLG